MQMKTQLELKVPAAAAWEILGERFGAIGEWCTAVESSSLQGAPAVGAVRTCHIGGFGPVKAGKIEERLLSYEPSSMRFSYQAISGTPRFMKLAINRWSIEPVGDERCIVRSHVTLEFSGLMWLLGPLVLLKMKRDARGIFEELEYRIEQGRPHPRKLAMATP